MMEQWNKITLNVHFVHVHVNSNKFLQLKLTNCMCANGYMYMYTAVCVLHVPVIAYVGTGLGGGGGCILIEWSTHVLSKLCTHVPDTFHFIFELSTAVQLQSA